ncbi:MAG: hypothetical protein KVP17_000193 [Porospora cf. gigantea B]|uniref:uncharacterized protein n=1 Tax=Porospora cf. gigantea B TaxID=2853592 RepID=UPI003571C07E|nr:MAG: hypothetical protein KVP17_000193 [Porospora cf. gigantea B]
MASLNVDLNDDLILARQDKRLWRESKGFMTGDSHAVTNDRTRCEKAGQKKNYGLTQESRKTTDLVLDQRTFGFLHKLIRARVFTNMYGAVSTGKEANVYYAQLDDVEDRALKVFKTSILVFRDRARYVDGEFRFYKYKGSNPRQMVTQWCEKEFRNLRRILTEGLRCPIPIDIRGHVFCMTFVGHEGTAAPRLKDVKGLSVPEWRRVYIETVALLKELLYRCDLVHGDLSEYNLLMHLNHPYIIDVSQSVDLSHPQAHFFLKRDCIRVTQFFNSKLAGGLSESDSCPDSIACVPRLAEELVPLTSKQLYEFVIQERLPMEFQDYETMLTMPDEVMVLEDPTIDPWLGECDPAEGTWPEYDRTYSLATLENVRGHINRHHTDTVTEMGHVRNLKVKKDAHFAKMRLQKEAKGVQNNADRAQKRKRNLPVSLEFQEDTVGLEDTTTKRIDTDHSNTDAETSCLPDDKPTDESDLGTHPLLLSMGERHKTTFEPIALKSARSYVANRLRLRLFCACLVKYVDRQALVPREADQETEENLMLHCWRPGSLMEVSGTDVLNSELARIAKGQPLEYGALAVPVEVESESETESESSESSEDDQEDEEDHEDEGEKALIFDGKIPEDVDPKEWKKMVKAMNREKRKTKIPKHVKKRQKKIKQKPRK